MTTARHTEPNPFALLMQPEVVFAALASSDRLARLTSRICRPLDKPLPVQSVDRPAASGDVVDSFAAQDAAAG